MAREVAAAAAAIRELLGTCPQPGPLFWRKPAAGPARSSPPWPPKRPPTRSAAQGSRLVHGDRGARGERNVPRGPANRLTEKAHHLRVSVRKFTPVRRHTNEQSMAWAHLCDALHIGGEHFLSLAEGA